MPDSPTCPLCATWECVICNHKYYYQNPNFSGTRKCKQCGSPHGSFIDVRHSSESMSQDHVDIYRFTETTEHKFDHYKAWDQYSTSLALEEMEEKSTMDNSAVQTPQDFEKAEWAWHPKGMFAHRGGPHVGGAAWAIASPMSDDVTYCSDKGMAERGDFEIVETETVLTMSQLGRLANQYEGETLLNVEELLVKAGVKIVDDPVIPVPDDFGVRFTAKRDDGPGEWEFVTIRKSDGLRVLCTDAKDYNGLCITPTGFAASGFTVVELL